MAPKPDMHSKEALDRLLEENAFLRSALEKTDQGRELIQQREEFSLLLAVSKLIVSELDLHTVFQLVADKARDLVQAEMLLVPMLNEQRDVYTYSAASGLDTEAVLDASFPVTTGMCGWVLRNERSLLFGESSICWLDESTTWERGQQSAVLVPLFGRKQIIGGLSALGKKGGGSFTPHDLDLLTVFANQVSTAIENAILFHQVQSEVEERKQAEDLLRASENRLHLATSAGNIGIWDWDIVNNELIWDDSMYSLYGIRRKDFDGAYEAWTRNLHPDDLQFVEQEIQAALLGDREYAPEFRIIRQDGTVRNIKAESQTIRDRNGKALRMIGTNIDITERRQSEEALRESEKKYRALVETTDTGFVIINGQGFVIDANPAYVRLSGHDKLKEILGRSVYEWTAEEDREKNARAVRMCMEQGYVRNLEIHYQGKDGVVTPVEINATILRTAEGEKLFSLCRDISERKRAEEQIVRSLREKDVMLKEIHHRVKNNMQVIYSLLSLQAKSVADPSVRALFVESQNRVHTMALIHERLYRSEDLAHIDFKEYLQSLVAGIANTYKRHDVVLSVDMEPLALDVNAGIPCGLIVNELVSNSLKYAFPDGRKGMVTVGIRKNREGNNVLTVADNGIGFPDAVAFRNTATLGLQLVNVLTGQIQGTIELSKTAGTTFCITFP